MAISRRCSITYITIYFYLVCYYLFYSFIDIIVFSRLYSIDTGSRNNNAERGKSSRTTGLNSPFGQRGEICSHFGWTYDYLIHSIPWLTVQLMLADAPRYETDNDSKNNPTPSPASATPMTPSELKSFFNNRKH